MYPRLETKCIASRPVFWWMVMARTSQFNARQLARNLGVSQRHLERITRQRFGLSPQQWINERRLVVAGTLLKAGLSVKYVRAELAFKSTSHFSASFKRFYGASPRTFLEEHFRLQRS